MARPGATRGDRRQPRATQSMEPSALDDEALRRHVSDTVDHVLATAPIHFDHMAFDLVFSLLVELTTAHGIDSSEVVPLLAGASPATVETAERTSSGSPPRSVTPAWTSRRRSTPPVAAASPEAKAAPTTTSPTTAGAPSVGTRCSSRPWGSDPTSSSPRSATRWAVVHRTRADPEPVRTSPKPTGRPSTSCWPTPATHRLQDDDVGLTYIWPMGLLRRAVLDAGRQLAERETLRRAGDLFSRAAGDRRPPRRGGRKSAQDLAERTDRREAAAGLAAAVPARRAAPAWRGRGRSRPPSPASPPPGTSAGGRAAGRSPDGCAGWASVARSRGAGPASSPRPATSATSNR